MNIRILVVALATLLPVAVSAPAFSATLSSQPLTVNIKRLSLDTALRIAKAAIDKCRKEGVQITVTVVDRGGHEQVVLRDVLTMPLATELSKKKAYTAMSFNTPTSQLETQFKNATSLLNMDELMILAGGIPINLGGTIMGGIGVSGAPSGATDELCAKAGLAAVSEDLEME